MLRGPQRSQAPHSHSTRHERPRAQHAPAHLAAPASAIPRCRHRFAVRQRRRRCALAKHAVVPYRAACTARTARNPRRAGGSGVAMTSIVANAERVKGEILASVTLRSAHRTLATLARVNRATGAMATRVGGDVRSAMANSAVLRSIPVLDRATEVCPASGSPREVPGLARSSAVSWRMRVHPSDKQHGRFPREEAGLFLAVRRTADLDRGSGSRNPASSTETVAASRSRLPAFQVRLRDAQAVRRLPRIRSVFSRSPDAIAVLVDTT